MSNNVEMFLLTKYGNLFIIKLSLIKGELILKNKFYSVQDWLPFKKVLDSGIILLKNNSYIKILKISPINFNLKSDLEKEAILNSYKIFLKTCNFNLQILIQSNKKDLSQNISKIKKLNENNSKKFLVEKYCDFIKNLNEEKNTNSKSFYILIKEENEKISTNSEKTSIQKLNEKYLKIKESLSRCGNKVEEINSREQIEKILFNSLNYRKQNKEVI